MNINPLFSVLIANYNNGNYLLDAIDSVRVQTYTNWEIIIVDDASTDTSKDFYNDLEKDERIHVFYNEENRGCGYTKRRCIELAKGELCAFLDPDDIISKDALKIMVKEHTDKENISMAYSDLYYCDEKLNITSVTHRGAIPENTTYLEYYKYVSQFAVFKRSFYLKTEGINADVKRAVDHDLYFKLEEIGPFAYVSRALYYYRIGTGQNISLGNNHYKALFWDYVVMADACRRRGLPVESVVMPRFLDEISKIDILRNSFSYRLGNLLLGPFRPIRNFIRKILKR